MFGLTSEKLFKYMSSLCPNLKIKFDLDEKIIILEDGESVSKISFESVEKLINGEN